MVKNSLLSFFLLFTLTAFSQKNCLHDHTGLIPLPDLGTGYYRGEMGGLYPEGSNTRPDSYDARCLAHVSEIKPLDEDGNYDPDGKIVMLAIGASNPGAEFSKFVDYLPKIDNINQSLTFVNACEGAVGINEMYSEFQPFWNTVDNEFEDEGLSYKQVQVIWVEQENMWATDTAFPSAALSLVTDYKLLLHTIKNLFPNAKICYISARAYSGYIDTNLYDELRGLMFPRDYYDGFAIKWLIENVIDQEEGFVTEGPDADIPIVSWATYHWTDGSTPSENGLFLDCETDVADDGLHLSGNGESKMGQLMIDFFMTDATAAEWIYDKDYSDVETSTLGSDYSLYPNPVAGGDMYFTSDVFETGEQLGISVNSIDGALISSTINNYNSGLNIDTENLTPGIYFITVNSGDKTVTGKFVVVK